jgi:hypothetical protein
VAFDQEVMDGIQAVSAVEEDIDLGPLDTHLE